MVATECYAAASLGRPQEAEALKVCPQSDGPAVTLLTIRNDKRSSVKSDNSSGSGN